MFKYLWGEVLKGVLRNKCANTLLLFICLFSITPLFASDPTLTQKKPIRIGITSVILDQKQQFLETWKAYFEARLNQPVEFVQRDSYGKITSHLLKGELDFGWICGYPYVQHQSLLNLVATPLFKGKPLYQSYLIVAKTDTETHSINDLKNTVFAYSDPDSNSGYLYAQYSLRKNDINPESFFSQTFFTWQHENTVEAVAVGLAKAGQIDSYIWESMKQQNNPFIKKTRIAHKSEPFGFPPLVATKTISPQLQKSIQHILLSMRNNAQGRRLLEQLNIDGFKITNKELYDDILKMHLFIEKQKHAAS